MINRCAIYRGYVETMFANFAAIFSLTLAKTLQSHLVYLKITVNNIINIFAENIIYRYFVCVFRLRKNSFVMFHIRQVKRNRGTRIRLLFTFVSFFCYTYIYVTLRKR